MIIQFNKEINRPKLITEEQLEMAERAEEQAKQARQTKEIEPSIYSEESEESKKEWQIECEAWEIDFENARKVKEILEELDKIATENGFLAVVMLRHCNITILVITSKKKYEKYVKAYINKIIKQLIEVDAFYTINSYAKFELENDSSLARKAIDEEPQILGLLNLRYDMNFVIELLIKNPMVFQFLSGNLRYSIKTELENIIAYPSEISITKSDSKITLVGNIYYKQHFYDICNILMKDGYRIYNLDNSSIGHNLIFCY